MPESPGALVRNPGLMAWLRARANPLAIAGPAAGEPDAQAEAIEAIRELAADAPATWVIVCGSPAPGLMERGWPAAVGGGTLPPTSLLPAAPPIPAPLADGHSPVRRALFSRQQARRFEAALEMLEERIQGDVRVQTARRKALGRRATSLGERAPELALREAADAARRAAGERLARLRTDLAEGQRERTLPSSIASNKFANLIEDLSADDLARETTGTAVILGLAPGTLKQAERLLREVVRAELGQDFERARAGLGDLERDLAAQLAPLGPETPPLTVDRLDEPALARSIEAMIRIEPRYRAELPQRSGVEGLFEWAMHGRRPVFLITLMSSMGVPFLVDLKERIAPLMALIFVGGLWLARRSFIREQHEKIERELVRIREVLRSELDRLHEEVLRDWQGLALRHLQEVERAIGRATEEWLKARLADLATRSARERVEVQDKLKVVDNCLRELGALVQQVGRTRMAAGDVRRALEQAGREALGPLSDAARAT
jgi:hypothetical protein